MRNTLIVAKELLGKHLVRHILESEIVGRIVEVEAYGGNDDPGSHASRGMTPRNKLMFGEGGFAYVYFVYGIHYCFNVVTEKQDVPGAVLIRALEPIRGIETMKKNRGTSNVFNLTSGPGKLTKAMNINGKQNGLDLAKSRELFIRKPEEKKKFEVESANRIGIKLGVDKPWRLYIRNNRFVSKK